MRYNNVHKGIFIDSPNRFIAHVMVCEDGVSKVETVHVKNTGRCRELLIKGVTVYLEKSSNPERKTRYDLIAVEKAGFGLINIDSQAPNKVVAEWLSKQDVAYVKPEYVYGDSRLDFYIERDNEKYLMEVKGCTLEIDGVGYFPDAPTERGVKHLRELIKATERGYRCIAAFVIQMENVYEVRPNEVMHAEFAKAVLQAKEAGVNFLYLPCFVKPQELVIDDRCKFIQLN